MKIIVEDKNISIINNKTLMVVKKAKINYKPFSNISERKLNLIYHKNTELIVSEININTIEKIKLKINGR